MVRIAVAGASGSASPFSMNLGKSVVEALRARGHSVVVLTRTASNSSERLDSLKQTGINVASVDYNDRGSLATALKGVDIIVSTLAGPGIANQRALLAAGHQAGIKLFIPSEYGNDTVNVPELSPANAHDKQAFHADLKQSQIPYTLVWIGAFANVLSGLIRPVSGKFSISGSGDEPISWTTISDAAAYLAHIVTNIPLSQLGNKIHRIESGRYSMNQLVQVYLSKHPDEAVDVENVSPDLAWQQWLDSGMQSVQAYWRYQWSATGVGAIDHSGPLTNDLFAGHQWQDVRDWVK